MNPELQQLYQEVIIDHGKNPRNFAEMSDYTHTLDGFNPLCGDKLTLFLKVTDDVITGTSFNGEGCAISMASASLMTEIVKGKSVDEAKVLFDAFHKMVTDANKHEPEAILGKLAILAGVREFPMRVKCATLAWHTLVGALDHDKASASTE